MMNLKLRTKILLTSIICAVSALVIQAILFQRTSSRLIYSQAERESYQSLQNMQNELEAFFRGIETSIIYIYKDAAFLEDLSAGKDPEEMKKEYYSRAEDLATDRFETSDGVLALYIYTADHKIISTYRKFRNPIHKYPGDIYENTDEAKDRPDPYNSERVRSYVASDRNTMLISGYHHTGLRRDIIRFVVKLHQMNKRDDRIGYVVCDVDSKVILRIMSKYTISYNTYTWLEAGGDIPICAIENTDEIDRNSFQEICALIEAGQSPDKDNKLGGIVLFSVPQEKYDLTAYSLAPQSILRENQRLLSRNLVFIAIIMAILLTLLFLYVTKSLTRPLEQLSETAARIGQGETELRISYRSEDEIGKLGEEFNHMLDELQELIRKQYEYELLKNQAEYRSLQAQINPHFLYNTLDTMSSIASIQNCDIVSRLCDCLSYLFRYSLDTGHPYATVAMEINHLKNYIFIMNVRMRDEISYNFDIEDAVLKDVIPRITIQPLVENAVNHGLKNKHGEKWIKISANAVDGHLCIIVEDNGVGMDTEAINRRLSENDKGLTDSGKSIGIYNINARLKMVYGDEYGLRLESKLGEGTKARIEIPERLLDEIL
ncbi:MAG: sensor histidine kinase [Lachnospiraceae bacterium]|nr:sensor histidine kinase [Lachnospiraceae bacterium]